MTKQLKNYDLTTYMSNSYESRLLEELASIDDFLVSGGIPYSLFGGAGVAAYIGHFPRRLHDVDVLILSEHRDSLSRFLKRKGFELQQSEKSRKADFRKFVFRNHVYELIVSVFPGSFTLLNIDDSRLPTLGVFEFREAIQNSLRRTIHGLGTTQSVPVYVVPLEDLIISKLWPTFEPNTVHDLLLLFSTTDARHLNGEYLRQRLEGSGNLRWLCIETYERFEQVFRKTGWYKLAERTENQNIERVRVLLRDSLLESQDSKKP